MPANDTRCQSTTYAPESASEHVPAPPPGASRVHGFHHYTGREWDEFSDFSPGVLLHWLLEWRRSGSPERVACAVELAGRVEELEERLGRQREAARETNRALREAADAEGVHYLYLIRNPTTGLIKVGRSVNVRARLRTLAASAGCELELLASWAHYADCEKPIHAALAPHRRKGEWFDDVPAVRAIAERPGAIGELIGEATFREAMALRVAIGRAA